MRVGCSAAARKFFGWSATRWGPCAQELGLQLLTQTHRELERECHRFMEEHYRCVALHSSAACSGVDPFLQPHETLLIRPAPARMGRPDPSAPCKYPAPALQELSSCRARATTA